ncbi:MAG TPA: YncE family protein [Verrucomicrobiae bacterium]|jgi:YVTN family beta-propeller protein|nr:YncE family protein [Verrucomicrobiae bacterium]
MRSLRPFSVVVVNLVFLATAPLAFAQRLLTTITFNGTVVWSDMNRTTNRLYVITDTTMQVVDGSTNTVIDSVQLSGTPAGFVINPTANKIYIEDSTNQTISVFNGATDHVDTIITLTAAPTNLDVNPVTNKIYVAERLANAVVVIDGNTNQVTATIPVGNRPLQTRVDPVRNRIYVPNRVDNTVSIIDGSSNAVIGTVTVGQSPELLLLNTVTNKAYVNNYGDGQGNNTSLSIIDGASLTVLQTLNLSGVGALDVDQVSNRISVTTANNTVTIVDGATNMVATVLNVGNAPADVESDAVTNRLYVMNSGDNTVSVYDFANYSLVGTVGVGPGPEGALVNAVTNRVYVLNNNNTFSVITDANSDAVQFVPATPCRLLDTRSGGNGPILGGTSQSFILSQLGNCNIPATAAAYSLNVTVVPHGRLGYLTIWPTGDSQPTVSTMNSPDGRVKANAAIVPAGYQGAVSIYASDTTDVILDIDGYFSTPGQSTLAFYSLPPCRIVDTRNTNGDLGGPFLTGNRERDFPILESSCIPTGISPTAYSFNVTAVPHPAHQRLGYLSVWPAGQQQPVVSTLNNPTGTNVANAAIVPAGTNGAIAVYPNNDTDLLIDTNGYFGAPTSGGLSLFTVAPCRVIDTRNVGSGQPFQGELTVNVIGSACAPSSAAQAFVLNATVVPPGALGYLTLWPDGQNQPLVSTLNAVDGAVTSNMAIVPTNNGAIDAYASALTQLIVDISSYFAPTGTGGGGPAPTYFLTGNWTGTATVTDSGVQATYTVGASLSQTGNSLTATLMVQGEDGANVYTVNGQISGNTVTFSTFTNGIPDGVDVTGTISQDGLQVSGSDSLGTGSGTMTWDGQNTLTGIVSLQEPGSTDTWTATVSTDGQHLTGSATADTGDSSSWNMTRQ